MNTSSIHKIKLTFLCIFTFILVQNGNSATIPVQINNKDSVDINSEIRKGLDRLNEVLATKDLKTVMSIYDDSNDIIVIGSDSGEVFIGKERVQEFMKVIVSMPFIFSFDMDNVIINHDNNNAWVFVDGKMVHTRSDWKVSKIPYRIMAVMVKQGDDWKWKVFSGSIPRGE